MPPRSEKNTRANPALKAKNGAATHAESVTASPMRAVDAHAKAPLLGIGVLVSLVAFFAYRLGRRRSPLAPHKPYGVLRLPRFQHSSEARVTQTLREHFQGPDYHLLNHVTLQMSDGTTQIDHILISRFGIFVIETKDFSGWLYGTEKDAMWTKVHFRRKSRVQNPLRQNFRHLLAVQQVLDFLPPSAITGLVAVTGTAEFQTERPAGVLSLQELPQAIRRSATPIISVNRMHLCIGRLEALRLAITAQTDVEHVESLARRFGTAAV